MSTTTTIYVASYDPIGEDGGVGGHDWNIDRDVIERRFAEQSELAPETRVRLWETTADVTDRDAVTERLDRELWDNNGLPGHTPLRDTHPNA